MLDTNAVIGILKRRPKLLAILRRHSPSDFGISAITSHELFFGAYRSDRVDRNLAETEALAFEVLEFDKEDARLAGVIRAALAKAGTPIGPYDVLIAGQARARDLVVVTRNVSEFARVAGLRVEDWES
ncbi:MAG: type II toxin-antitoxin system VapC family toxin [Acetobacteraceae bacterium]